VSKSRKIKYARHMTRMVRREMPRKFWWAMPEIKNPIGRRRYRCKDKIRLYVK
jgi:hypothetical protein